MQKRLFIAGLPFSSTEAELREYFSGAGKIVSLKIITDRDSGRSKGFGFLEYETEDEARKAMEIFHESDFGGRKLIVAEAKPQEDRPRSFDSKSGGRGARDNNRGGGHGFSRDRRGGGGRNRFSQGGYRGGR